MLELTKYTRLRANSVRPRKLELNAATGPRIKRSGSNPATLRVSMYSLAVKLLLLLSKSGKFQLVCFFYKFLPGNPSLSSRAAHLGSFLAVINHGKKRREARSLAWFVKILLSEYALSR
jgi:hypothetical protein